MMNVAHQIIVPAPEVELVSVSPVIGTGSLSALDAIILAVPRARLTATPSAVFATLSPGGVFVDVKSALYVSAVPTGVGDWSL
jgi:hypothetical protein